MAVINPLFRTEAFTPLRKALRRMPRVIFYFLWEKRAMQRLQLKALFIVCCAKGGPESAVASTERRRLFLTCVRVRPSVFVCNSATARGPCETSLGLI